MGGALRPGTAYPLAGLYLGEGPHWPTFLGAFGAGALGGLGFVLDKRSPPPTWAELFPPSELVPFCACGWQSDSPQAAIGTRLNGDPCHFLPSDSLCSRIFILQRFCRLFFSIWLVPLQLGCLSPASWSGWYCASGSGWMLSLIPSLVNRIMPVLMSLRMLRISCQTKARKQKLAIICAMGSQFVKK